MPKHMYPDGYTSHELRQFYNQQATTYHRFERVLVWVGERRLRRQIMSQARGAVLDVACGTGGSFAFLPKDSPVTAVDISEGMLEHARHRADALGLKATLQQMDAQQLAFPDHSFDTVISALATCVFPNPIGALREMGRVCKPDGQVLLVEHGLSSLRPLAYLQNRYAALYYNSDACRWNQDSVQLLRDAGLQVKTVRRTLLGILYGLVSAPSTA